MHRVNIRIPRVGECYRLLAVTRDKTMVIKDYSLEDRKSAFKALDNDEYRSVALYDVGGELCGGKLSAEEAYGFEGFLA